MHLWLLAAVTRVCSQPAGYLRLAGLGWPRLGDMTGWLSSSPCASVQAGKDAEPFQTWAQNWHQSPPLHTVGQSKLVQPQCKGQGERVCLMTGAAANSRGQSHEQRESGGKSGMFLQSATLKFLPTVTSHNRVWEKEIDSHLLRPGPDIPVRIRINDQARSQLLVPSSAPFDQVDRTEGCDFTESFTLHILSTTECQVLRWARHQNHCHAACRGDAGAWKYSWAC